MFRSDQDPTLLAWRRFRDQIDVPARGTAPVVERNVRGISRASSVVGDSECGVWRLLASNNREVARSARAYRSFIGARDHVHRLQDLVDEMVVVTLTGRATGTYGWFVQLHGIAILTCSRWYPAASSSVEASLGSLALLRIAVVAEESRRLPGARRHVGTGTRERGVAW
ncbi:hypothetical protein [Luethyella okanaganae]|uniref:Uncharacterized protein n=1 Tax=Luethyella okanaganae TaxID=69372 RepID=A0ABW1VIN6_9MICO